jgi:hypothetical protein
MRTTAITLAAATAATLLLAHAALADTTLIARSGWQLDQVDAAGQASDSSNVDFTVANPGGATFRLTDYFIPGDVYTVTWAGNSATSSFTLYPDFKSDSNFGPQGFEGMSGWTSGLYSHLQLSFAPGSYSLSITGGGGPGGYPAGFLDRLDVPEPAAWAMMVVGLGAVGAALRRKSLAA